VSLPIEPTASSPVCGHRRHQELEVFLRVAEGLLAVEQRHVERARRARLDGSAGRRADLGALEPLAVGLGVGELAS
jgi:hypothetical protein